jgi:hypothetical protein
MKSLQITQTNLDHGPSGPVSLEAKALQKVAFALEPELFVDMHARGGAGCSFDMVLYPATKSYTEDDNTFHSIAADMCRAGEKAGIPQVTHPLTWPGWFDATCSTEFAYRNFKSIVMLTENSESNTHRYPAALTAKSGLAKVRALLQWGNRRHPKLYWSGYPNMLVSEFFSMGVLAWGANATQRRGSRLSIWKNAAHFKNFRLAYPEPRKAKKLLVDYAGPPLTDGVAFQLGVAGRERVQSVTFDGQPLRHSTAQGYYQFTDGPNSYVVAGLEKFQSGKHEFDIMFK